MAIMGTYQRVAILDCSSGIQLETCDTRADLLLRLLEGCEPTELARLRTEVIPGIEAERASLETGADEATDPDA